MGDVYNVGQTFAQNLKANDVVDFHINVPANARFTFKCSGTADVVVGVYETDQPIGSPGGLKIAGVAKWGCREMKAGPHFVRVHAASAGSFSFTFAPYTIFDEWGLRFSHHSS